MGHENRVSNIVYNQPLVLGKRTESGQLVVVVVSAVGKQTVNYVLIKNKS